MGLQDGAHQFREQETGGELETGYRHFLKGGDLSLGTDKVCSWRFGFRADQYTCGTPELGSICKTQILDWRTALLPGSVGHPNARQELHIDAKSVEGLSELWG